MVYDVHDVPRENNGVCPGRTPVPVHPVNLAHLLNGTMNLAQEPS